MKTQQLRAGEGLPATTCYPIFIMSINTQIKTIKAVWIIFDPLDGAHVFGSEAKAKNTLERWKKEADYDPMDSVWDMTGPLKYSLENK